MTNHDFIATLAHEFELAFLSTGLSPIHRSFGDGQNDGCLITALDVSEHGNQTPTALWDWLRHDLDRVDRVRDHLQRKFGHLVNERSWWRGFVWCLIRAFDNRATAPSRWLKRAAHEPFRASVSCKKIAAATGLLLRKRLLEAQAICETVPARMAKPVERDRAVVC